MSKSECMNTNGSEKMQKGGERGRVRGQRRVLPMSGKPRQRGPFLSRNESSTREAREGGSNSPCAREREKITVPSSEAKLDKMVLCLQMGTDTKTELLCKQQQKRDEKAWTKR